MAHSVDLVGTWTVRKFDGLISKEIGRWHKVEQEITFRNHQAIITLCGKVMQFTLLGLGHYLFFQDEVPPIRFRCMECK